MHTTSFFSNRSGIALSVIASSTFSVFKNGPTMAPFKTYIYLKNIFQIKILSGFGKLNYHDCICRLVAAVIFTACLEKV